MAIPRILSALPAIGLGLIFSNAAKAQFIPLVTTQANVVQGTPTAMVVGYFSANFSAAGITAGTGSILPAIAVASAMPNGPGYVTLFQEAPSGMFMAAAQITVGTDPSAMAVGDFDCDGNQDLVVVNQGDSTVTVLLGNGQGGFTPAPSASAVKVGTSPISVAVGHFTPDAVPGLAIANRGSATVTVLLGSVNNHVLTYTPSPGSPFPVGNGPTSIAAGDFNGDGISDLAVTNVLDNTVTVLLGDGTGGFAEAPASPFLVGSNPYSVAVADFNGDLNLDLAIADLGSNSVTVLLGNGSGGFTAAASSPFAVGLQPDYIAIADFNGDTFADLAVANFKSSNVSILLGNGKGGFTAQMSSPISLAPNPVSIAVGDFNLDGMPDLAVASTLSEDVSVLLNTLPSAPVMKSSASYVAGMAAPGSLVSIFGSDAAGAPSLAMGTAMECLGGIAVTLTDSSGAQDLLPLFFTGPGQINAMIPQSAVTGAATFAISTSPSCGVAATGVLQAGSVTLAATAPALFSTNQKGTGLAAAQFVSGVVNGNATPMDTFECPAIISPATVICNSKNLVAAPLVIGSNSALVLYGTGIRNRQNLSNVSVVIGTATLPNQTLQPFYAGPTSYLGEDQVNVILPPILVGAGTASITVAIGSQTSNVVTVCFENPPGLTQVCTPPTGN